MSLLLLRGVDWPPVEGTAGELGISKGSNHYAPGRCEMQLISVSPRKQLQPHVGVGPASACGTREFGARTKTKAALTGRLIVCVTRVSVQAPCRGGRDVRVPPALGAWMR